MSAPFAKLCADRAATIPARQLQDEVFRRFNRWSLQSSEKLVSLDEVAWIGALLTMAFKASGLDITKTETRDENGARVVGVVANDGVQVADGAG